MEKSPFPMEKSTIIWSFSSLRTVKLPEGINCAPQNSTVLPVPRDPSPMTLQDSHQRGRLVTEEGQVSYVYILQYIYIRYIS